MFIRFSFFQKWDYFYSGKNNVYVTAK